MSRAAVALCVLLAGCATGRIYDGERRPREEVARISGDMRVTAGAPVSVILLKVGDYRLGLKESAVEVLPGTYELLVDCRVAETSQVTRMTIDAEVYAGVRYRLVAETGPGLRECTSVRLESLD